MEEQVGERFPSLWGSAEQQLKQMLIHVVFALAEKKICCCPLLVPGASLRNPCPWILLSREKKKHLQEGSENAQPNYRDQDHYFFVLFVSRYVQTGLSQCPGHQPSVQHV